MEDLLNKLVEERARVWNQGKEVLDRIESDGDKARAEDESTWQNVNAELDKLDERIAVLNKRLKGEKEADEARALAERFVRPADGAAPDAQSESDKLVDWMRASNRARSSGEAVPRAFEFSTAGLEFSVENTGLRHIRNALSVTDDGDLVPDDFRRQLYEHLIENSAIRQTNATVFTTTGGNPIPMPKTTSHPGATQVSEGGTIPQSDPAFAQGTLNAYKYGNLILVSTELLEDEGLPAGVLLGYLARRGGQAIANDQGTDFVLGDGSGKPEGFIVGGTHVGVTAGATALTADHLIRLQYSVIDPYASRGWWIMNRTTAGVVRRLKDGNGAYVWGPSLAVGAPNTILERPYVTDPNMPAMGTAATAISFGDFSPYHIRDVGNVRFERSDDFAFDTDQVAFRILQRSDGLLLDTTGAIKHIVGGTA